MFDETLPGPKFVQLFAPVLAALNELGGSARPSEVCEQIAADLQIDTLARDELLDSGTPRFDNTVAWARFYLAKAEFIDSSQRGVWTLTDKGRDTRGWTHERGMDLFKRVHSKFGEQEGGNEPASSSFLADDKSIRDSDSQLLELNHRHVVLETMQALPPDGFERFCQRLLRESGFQQVEVTGRSGDGGIDGIGILEVNPLVTFKVLFQCKRYKGSVTPSQVRDFRGAMIGRADKGIIITTGSYTTVAKKEAVRDGVPPIELLDGEKIVDMLEKLELGLVPVQAFRVDDVFFDDFK